MKLTATKPPRRKISYLSWKNRCSLKRPLKIAYQSKSLPHEATKLPKSHTKSRIVYFNQTFF